MRLAQLCSPTLSDAHESQKPGYSARKPCAESETFIRAPSSYWYRIMSPRVLLHPLTERHTRRGRPARGAVSLHKRSPEPTPALEPRDIAVERVRASGGPLDEASYVCQCGYLFAAPVSTTVSCPHCGTSQAW
jgi:hypothetical protein